MTASDGAVTTVLIVEDERDLCDLYATWLDDAFDVRVAYNGTDALEIVDDVVDVVLLDRRMPDRSGDDVLGEIRDRGLGCRVVMVTAVDPEFDIVDLGFDDYLTKPVSPDELRAAVDSVLVRRQYDSRVQELFALYSTRRVLEADGVASAPEHRAEYEELQGRIAALEAELDDRLAAFDEGDFRAAFLTLGDASPASRPDPETEFENRDPSIRNEHDHH